MRLRILSWLAVLVLICAVASAIEAPLPRHPAPSPDGETIAFSWQGDLWLVAAAGGTARRLTAHPAAERHPVWSRDGEWIAFSSDRHGNPDVFVMRADGSEAPRRMTHASVSDRPLDFSVDGSSLLFVSSRAESVRRMPGLYSVPMSGGTPVLAQPALGQHASFSPNGEALVFVRGATRWTRRGYRGAANRDLWLHDQAGEYLQLTDFAGDDDWPTWVDGHTVVFSSSRSGRKNLFLLNLVDGSASALTDHQGSDVRFPRAAADGSVVAYEFEDAVWTVRPAGGEPKSLNIDVPPDRVVNPVQRHVVSDGADDLVVSPDGKLAAFTVHGEVFVTELICKDDQEVAPPRTVRITRTADREKDLAWAPDGKTLICTSARAGSDDLYLLRPAEEGAAWIDAFDFSAERLTANDDADVASAYSPDGELIAFVRGRGDLMVINSDGSGERRLLEHWSTPDFQWSPDGKWIAYEVPDVHYNSEVWIVPVAGGEAYNVSRHPDDDVQPRWSPDGRRLLWVSKRHADTLDVWGVWLARADHQRTPAEWLQLWRVEDEKKKAEEKADDEEEDDVKPDLVEVHIDFDGLWERSLAITDLKGHEGLGVVGPRGRRVVFTAMHQDEIDLYSVRWDGKDLKRLTEGGEVPSAVQLVGEENTLFYLDGKGRIKRLALDGTAGDPAPFEARYEVDESAERGATFDEAWRALNQWFYDPDFHGVNWRAQYRLYRPWALAASHPADFADVVNMMLGELNASHMAYRPKSDQGGEKTGFLGVVVDPAAGGPGLQVTEVLPDSPADREDVKLAAGERIITVDGSPVQPSSNLFAFFADAVGHRVRLTVEDKGGVRRRVWVTPTDASTIFRLRYREWVKQRRRLVERFSDGRLGYLHIQSMNIPSFEDFERSLFAAGHDKDGLVIDVRSNGGGWTTDYLMAVLNVQRHAYTVPRGDSGEIRAYPQSRLPLAAWTRPAVTLCNEDSASNAEIFSYAFKELQRGALVGSPTFGAVISTGGTRLIDGGWVRLPTRGWFVAGSGINMENNGAEPEIVIWQPPAEDTAAEVDSQLAKAVEVLLDGLEEDPRYNAW